MNSLTHFRVDHIHLYTILKWSIFEVLRSSEPHRLPRDNQRDREKQTLLKSITSHRVYIPVWEQFATDLSDPWQVVPRQVFTPYSRLLISTAFVFVRHVGCLGVTGVRKMSLED